MANDQARRFDDLFAAWATGTLQMREFTEFQDLLQRDPALRRRFHDACYEESALHAVLRQRRASFAAHHATARPQRRHRAKPARSRATWVLALAAGLLVGLLLAPVALRLAHPDGARTDTGLAGQTIAAGAHPRTIAWPNDASELVLTAGTTVTVVDVSKIELQTGRIDAAITGLPARQGFAVRSPEALTEVMGTRFSVASDNGTTRVTVSEGQVRVTDRASSARHILIAGEALSLGDDG